MYWNKAWKSWVSRSIGNGIGWLLIDLPSYVKGIFWNWFGLKSAGLVIRCLTFGFLVPVRVNAPVRSNPPRKSYLAHVFQSKNKCLGNLAPYVFQRRHRMQTVLFDKCPDSWRYLHFALEKKSKQEHWTSQGEITLKISCLFFFKPTPILSVAKMKLVGNSTVWFFQNMSMKLTEKSINQKNTHLLTSGCLASHGQKFT